MTVQISFLGKSMLDSQTGYRTTRYRFENGAIHESAFFALSLAESLQPQRLVLLGTAGSMWDTLVENQVEDDALEQQRLALIDAVRDNAVTDDLLAPLAPLVEQRLGTEVVMKVIPYGYDAGEQSTILTLMADSLNQHTGGVVLDVTHGLRHLPMLALVAAFYLEKVAGIKVDDILYGAYEMRDADNRVPVLSLKGLLDIMDWVQALTSYDREGNYAAFIPLLEEAGMDSITLNHLRRAAHAERVFNHQDASTNLLQVLPVLENDLPGAGSLFTPALRRRLEWARDTKPHRRLAAIARERLAHGDYVRAAIATDAAFLTGMVKDGERTSEYETFEKIKKEFRNGQRGDPDKQSDYEALTRLRNALAHGTSPKNKDDRRIRADEDRLYNRLRELIDHLLPENE